MQQYQEIEVDDENNNVVIFQNLNCIESMPHTINENDEKCSFDTDNNDTIEYESGIEKERKFKAYISHNEEIRRFSAKDSWESLTFKIASIFQKVPFSVLYEDEEGDKITISSQTEYGDMIAFQKTPTIKIYIKLSQNVKPVNNNLYPDHPKASGNYQNDTRSQPTYFGARPMAVNSQYEHPYNEKQTWKSERAEWKKQKKQERKEWKNQRRNEKRQVKSERKMMKKQMKSYPKHGLSDQLCSRFIKHVTVPDGSIVRPNYSFKKIWRLRNEGSVAWPADTGMVFLSQMGGYDFGIPGFRYIGRVVNPSETIDIALNLSLPNVKEGKYFGYWQLCTSDGRKFGHKFWVCVTASNCVNYPPHKKI